MQYNLIATCTFGVESIVSYELKSLGYTNLSAENGKISFSGNENDIAKCNLWLRTADRVLLKMSEFKATDFEELFQGSLKLKWEDIIPENGKMHVIGKSVKSKLFSVPDCQQIVKKSIIESMKRRYKREWFNEDGPLFTIEISLINDIATITLDTSGQGLHKRGYREEAGEAPLRENIAAALIYLSRWTPPRILADPLCGSGTIAIEAALIGRNMPPGINRSFAAENWPFFPKDVWKIAKEDAKSKLNDTNLSILASDKDTDVLEKAKRNAKNAGVGDYIVFNKMPVERFTSDKSHGYIICNPPYGERIGDAEYAQKLYKGMSKAFFALNEWSFFILSAYPDFQKHFGKKADKNRKLYNGNLKCYLYEYLGNAKKVQSKNGN